MKFIKFDIDASEQDESDLKAEVESYLNDRDEYSNAAKATVTVKGLKNTTDYEAFINENKSDLGIDNGYKYKNQIAPNVAEEVFNAALGDVIGAYKENGYFKISKVTEIIDLPDSVKSSHILVGYIGATRSTSTKTKEEAKNEISQLIDELVYYNDQYYQHHQSLISDYEFDMKLKKLQDLENDFPEFSYPYSPTQRIGGTITKSFDTVIHRSPMLSLSNTYSEEELSDFDTRVSKGLEGESYEIKKACELNAHRLLVLRCYFFFEYLSQTANKLNVYRYCSMNCIHSGREYHPNRT